MQKLILFQGDSITDAGRLNERASCSDPSLGVGYVTIAAAQLSIEKPEAYHFLNRGIGGNRIVDLYARIKRDAINLQPDVMSILVGVNDVWHEYDRQNGVDAEKFERIYGMFLEEVLQALPQIKLMLLEPYVLEGAETCNTEQHPNRWDYFQEETRKRAQAVRRLAERFGVVFVPLQESFQLASQTQSTPLTLDGVHPTLLGHALIAQQWRKGFDLLGI